jgi:Flp pilus assembly protein TadG
MQVKTPLARTWQRSRAARAQRSRCRGQSLVEFALIAPVLLVLLLGIAITAVAMANQNLLNNGVRDSARAAAICGGAGASDATELPPTGGLQAQSCSWSNLDVYVRVRLTQLAGGNALAAPSGGSNCAALAIGAALVCLYTGNNAAAAVSGDPLDSCRLGDRLEISAQYRQPLFVPFVGQLLGGGNSNSVTLRADAVATCEQ